MDDTLSRFIEDAGGANSDEYTIAIQIKEGIDAKDFGKLQALSKKPIFSFLETEIVKAFKRAIMNPPASMTHTGPAIGDEIVDKKKVLDSLML